MSVKISIPMVIVLYVPASITKKKREEVNKSCGARNVFEFFSQVWKLHHLLNFVFTETHSFAEYSLGYGTLQGTLQTKRPDVDDINIYRPSVSSDDGYRGGNYPQDVPPGSYPGTEHSKYDGRYIYDHEAPPRPPLPMDSGRLYAPIFRWYNCVFICNRIVCLSVRLSVCLSVRNSVPLTKCNI